METPILKIDIKELPIIVQLVTNNEKREYVIKPNKERTGIFLNKKETY